MEAKQVNFTTIDEYIAQFPPDIQQILQSIRTVIRAAAPEAKEKISYQMPGFEFHGSLVWFAAFKHHIGFYPTGAGMAAFKAELTGYKTSKGAVQFPLDQPIPYDLITRMVKARVAANLNAS